MNLNKHREFFDPDTFEDNIHIIGCGAVGSTIAEQLARLGFKSLHLYDFDTVSEHNITNQMFLHRHIGHPKLTGLTDILKEINPDIQITNHHEGWEKGTPLNGYIIIAVDNIDTRKEIVQDNLFNPLIKAAFDVRMRLTDAQHYATLWNTKDIQNFLKTMNFSREEAAAATPTSACGTTLSVTPTVRLICSYAVANLINVILKKPITKTLLIDAFNMTLEAYDDNGLKE